MFNIFKRAKEPFSVPTRKERSEVILKKNNIKINYNLPHIEADDEVSIRDEKDIARRMVILCVTNLVAFGNTTGDEAFEYLEKHSLLQFITANEKEFLNDPTPEKKNHESWKCECIWVLAWALNVTEALQYPDHLCDLNEIAQDDYPLSGNPNDFINRNWNARSKAEILDAADLYYRMDWAVVDARLNNLSIEPLNSGVIYERHYALNWLINYMDQAWDDISCDT